MNEQNVTETTSRQPRWVRAAIGGVAVGVLAVGIAAAMNLDDHPKNTPRASAEAGAVGPSTTTPTDPTEPVPTGNGVARTITVTGEGTATVKPDIATVQIGVSVQRSSADAALQEANTSATALIAALKDAGVADDDIATSNLSIWPQYDSSRIVGYTASNTVSVTVRDITTTGPVIDAAAGAAGEDISISGISFGLSDPEQAMATARADAIANASKRAGEFATAAGAGVGDVLQISETAVQPFTPTVYTADSAAGGARPASVPTPIQTGTTDVSVTVNVVYALT